jgi:AcrR family transcriptional regulator
MKLATCLASRPTKGQQTRVAILDCALIIAGRKGLEGLSIGLLATEMKMSKSGVFAHFGSREALQLAVIQDYHARFEEEVFRPALKCLRGLPRLARMFDLWVERIAIEVSSGCIYISGAVEFDDCPGLVRDALVDMLRTWHHALERCIELSIERGHLLSHTDKCQLVFEMHSLILGFHHDARLLGNPRAPSMALTGFKRLLQPYATEVGWKALQDAQT